MKPTKKQVIDKILSFNYEELERWIRARLHGDDKYFPIYEGYDTNLSEFLTETYENIKSEKFRDNFLEILNDLTEELSGYSTGEAQKEAEYIYELLSLCAAVKQFENTDILYEIAVSGDLKGIKAFDLDLHQLLLNTLGSFRLSGDYEFWFEQMRDDSNKYYANAAFYALLNREYSLDIIFRCIDVFVQRFMGEIDLELGIQELIDKYGKEEVGRRFAGIGEILSWEQKEAVDNALVKSGYDPVYQLKRPRDYVSRQQSILYSAEKISQSAPLYETTTKLQEITIRFLRFMGYNEELNPVIAGHSIDILFKKKKKHGDRYEGRLCFFSEEEGKVEKNKINRLGLIKQDIWNELQKESNHDRYDHLQLIVICQKGFTPGATDAAKTYGIELRTLGQLVDELIEFDKSHKRLIHHSKSM
jgi:hypothetical protein